MKLRSRDILKIWDFLDELGWTTEFRFRRRYF